MTDQSRAQDAADMAALTRQLANIVSKMVVVYERRGNALNDEQPASFQNVIAGSLDEWWIELLACSEDWAKLAVDSTLVP